MSKKKKIMLGVICAVVLAAFVATMVALLLKGNDTHEDDGYDKTIVYLGDSISEGLLGPSPVSERDSSAYYAIIGRSNNYRYIESAVSGDDTAKLYAHLNGTNTADLERQYWVQQADIIHVSILGNDVLVGDIGKNAYNWLIGDTEVIDGQISRATEYFALLIDRIKELNPDALLMVNTLYNPLDSQSTLISNSIKEQIIEYYDGDMAGVRKVGAGLIGELLNGIVYDYLEEHPNAYEIIDVYTAFDNIYNQNYQDGISLFYKDWMHPSNEGHAVIAGLIQAKLEAKGLADNSRALERYKKLRTEQTDRLFNGTWVDIVKLKASIASATTMDEVSSVYSKTVRGITPIYVRGERSALEFNRPQGEVFAQKRFFALTSFGYEGGLDLVEFMDLEKTGFTFNPDGTFKFTITPNSLLLGLANVALYQEIKDGGIDLSDMLDGDNFAQSAMGAYVLEVFPGLDLRELEKAFSLLTSVGIYINGFSDKDISNLATSLRDDMKVPSTFTLPKELSIELRGWYVLSKTDEFTNINLGLNNVSPHGHSFFFSTLHVEEDGADWTETAVEVSKLIITAQEQIIS